MQIDIRVPKILREIEVIQVKALTQWLADQYQRPAVSSYNEHTGTYTVTIADNLLPPKPRPRDEPKKLKGCEPKKKAIAKGWYEMAKSPKRNQKCEVRWFNSFGAEVLSHAVYHPYITSSRAFVSGRKGRFKIPGTCGVIPETQVIAWRPEDGT